jgi:hypothetical protein
MADDTGKLLEEMLRRERAGLREKYLPKDTDTLFWRNSMGREAYQQHVEALGELASKVTGNFRDAFAAELVHIVMRHCMAQTSTLVGEMEARLLEVESKIDALFESGKIFQQLAEGAAREPAVGGNAGSGQAAPVED